MKKPIALMAAGMVLFTVGILYLLLVQSTPRVLLVAAYLCIGVGCGVFGHGLGDVLARKAAQKDPAQAHRIAVEQNDERSRSINGLAKAKAYDMAIPVWGALLLVFALMGVDLVVILLLVAAYLLMSGVYVYWLARYQKEM